MNAIQVDLFGGVNSQDLTEGVNKISESFGLPSSISNLNISPEAISTIIPYLEEVNKIISSSLQTKIGNQEDNQTNLNFIEESKDLFNYLLYIDDEEFNSYKINDRYNFKKGNNSFTISFNSKTFMLLKSYRRQIKKVISLIEHFYGVDSEIKGVLHDLKQCPYFDEEIFKSHLSIPGIKKLNRILKQ